MYYFDSITPFEMVFHRFSRDFPEVKGWNYKVAPDGNSAKVYINALGIDPENIDVTWQHGEKRNSVEFRIKGETTIDDLRPYNVDFAFTVYKPVKQLKKSFKNGMVILELFFDKPSQPEIELLD